MKKKMFLSAASLFLAVTVNAQELLINGNFELWDDTNTPSSWTIVEESTQEVTEIRNGSFAIKHVGGTSDLAQTISGIVPGNSYTISLWYKVDPQGGDNSNTRIWSYWKDADLNNITDEDTEDALRGPNGSYFDNNGHIWTEYTTTVTAPDEASFFNFELRTYAGATVYYDDLSFYQNLHTASIPKNPIEGFNVYPNPIAGGIFTISTKSNASKLVSVFNMLGKKVMETSFTGISKKINCETLQSGFYMLKVIEADKISVQKLLIE